jgi:hypothetical protein
MSAATCAGLSLRAAATRAACSRALATVICGSSPDPEVVTASIGTSTFEPRPFSLRYAATRCETSDSSVGFDGPRFDPPLAMASYPCAPAADGRGWKYWTSGRPLASVKFCPMSEEPTTLPLTVTSDPLARDDMNASEIPVTASG